MTGTIRINIWMGSIAFLVTLVTALSGNVFSVSLERAVYAFFLFFLGMFPIRWGLHLITAHSEEKVGNQDHPNHDSQRIGENINLVTPDSISDDEEFQRTKTESLPEDDSSDQFTPLIPRRIELNPKNPENDPTNIANVIRRLTDE